MALDPCVRLILCPLGSAVLGAINGLINTQIIAIEALVTGIQAQILALDVATAPLSLARNAAVQVVNAAESAAGLIPLELIAGCADLGDFNLNIAGSIDAALAEVTDIIDDVNRLLSFRAELQAAVDVFNHTIEQFKEIQLVIEECAA